ncbi:Uncharacterised protein [Vibrio cholerae]|uniref:Uncharacterized protein n=1 Tax=Vibrio cholerae TaxID=666 RepID=A0A655UZ13_VIBCL|nr:Uncharacterised protein [Vibrio cholerae]
MPCSAIWCAACARGGTNLPSACVHWAKSPMTKMSSSRVVCSVPFTTNWLIRFVSRPAISFMKSGALIPAAQTMMCAEIFSPSLVVRPSFSALVTMVIVRTLTPNLVSSWCAAAEMRGGSAGKIRSPASIKFTFSLLESRSPNP